MKSHDEQSRYESPRIETVTGDDVVEVLGPVSAGSGGMGGQNRNCDKPHPVFPIHPSCKP